MVKTQDLRDIAAKSVTRLWHLQVYVTFLSLKSIFQTYFSKTESFSTRDGVDRRLRVLSNMSFDLYCLPTLMILSNDMAVYISMRSQ